MLSNLVDFIVSMDIIVRAMGIKWRMKFVFCPQVQPKPVA